MTTFLKYIHKQVHKEQDTSSSNVSVSEVTGQDFIWNIIAFDLDLYFIPFHSSCLRSSTKMLIAGKQFLDYFREHLIS